MDSYFFCFEAIKVADIRVSQIELFKDVFAVILVCGLEI